MQFSTLLLSSLAIFAVSAAPTPGNGYGSGGSGGDGGGDGNGGSGGDNGSGGSGSGGSGSGNGGGGSGGISACPPESTLCCNSAVSTPLGGLLPVSLPDLLGLQCGLGGILLGTGPCVVQAACCQALGDNISQVCDNFNGATFLIPINLNL